MGRDKLERHLQFVELLCKHFCTKEYPGSDTIRQLHKKMGYSI